MMIEEEKGDDSLAWECVCDFVNGRQQKIKIYDGIWNQPLALPEQQLHYRDRAVSLLAASILCSYTAAKPVAQDHPCLLPKHRIVGAHVGGQCRSNLFERDTHMHITKKIDKQHSQINFNKIHQRLLGSISRWWELSCGRTQKFSSLHSKSWGLHCKEDKLRNVRDSACYIDVPELQETLLFRQSNFLQITIVEMALREILCCQHCSVEKCTTK